ncbi:hypothetical protein Lbir_1319 [Legionella birminghamensis]|uniref:Uncharacterized protein n=1 Tax=Legionella birminghamensis TaxID=28083 RepID=A0A378IA88_9GAMM|nr:hypothetical protein [Legionella birminghamensis]KTC72544.1 hypothetical protein Lbir_1319 [Legionella birminghamensis]STX32147.1 Uncharacterised protein [Legionella birminghamensis]
MINEKYAQKAKQIKEKVLKDFSPSLYDGHKESCNQRLMNSLYNCKPVVMSSLQSGHIYYGSIVVDDRIFVVGKVRVLGSNEFEIFPCANPVREMYFINSFGQSQDTDSLVEPV